MCWLPAGHGGRCGKYACGHATATPGCATCERVQHPANAIRYRGERTTVPGVTVAAEWRLVCTVGAPDCVASVGAATCDDAVTVGQALGWLIAMDSSGRAACPRHRAQAKCSRCGELGHWRSGPGRPAGENCRAAKAAREAGPATVSNCGDPCPLNDEGCELAPGHGGDHELRGVAWFRPAAAAAAPEEFTGGELVQPGDPPVFGATYFDPHAGFYVLRASHVAVPGGVSSWYRGGAIKVECKTEKWQATAVANAHRLIEVVVKEGAPPAAAGAPDELEAVLELFRQEWEQLPAKLAADAATSAVLHDVPAQYDLRFARELDRIVPLIVARCELLSAAHLSHVIRVLSGA